MTATTVPVRAITLEDLATVPATDPREALREWLEEMRSENTRRAYRADLEIWRSWLSTESGISVETMDDAAAVLACTHPIRLRELVVAFARWQREQGKSVATTLRRVSTVRALTDALRRAGCTTNTIDIDRKHLAKVVGKRGPTRNTKGAELSEVAAILRVAAAQPDPVLAARDVALLWLLVGLGLRRFEVAGLTLDHVDLGAERPTVSILGKGRDEREDLTIPAQAVAAIRRWLDIRPYTESNALFVTCDRRTRGQPIGDSAVYSTVRRLAKAAGVDPRRCRPHGFRHAFGSLAARATDGNAFRVRTAMRHASVTTSQVYVDAEDDEQGRVATAVAGLVAAAL